MDKPVIFISHMTEEKDVAIAFQKLIESSFLGMVDVFVSSDDNSILLGKRWLDKITHSLQNCTIEIILCSPESVTRPWINFESGAGWIRNIPVIPLCHAGLDRSDLELPLQLLQSANATNKQDLKNVINIIAAELGANPPDPNFDEFISKVSGFSSKRKKPIIYLPLKENFCNKGLNDDCQFSVFPHLKMNSGTPERVEFKKDGYVFNGMNMLSVHTDNHLPDGATPRSFAFAIKAQAKPKRDTPMFFFSYGQRKEHENSYVNNHDKAFGLFWGVPVVDGPKGFKNPKNTMGVKLFFYCERQVKNQISDTCDTKNIFKINPDSMHSWIRIVITYNGEQLKLYKDGVEIYTQDIELKTATSRYLNIGGFLHHSIKGAFVPADIDYSMKGFIREFHVYDHSLSLEEVLKVDTNIEDKLS